MWLHNEARPALDVEESLLEIALGELSLPMKAPRSSMHEDYGAITYSSALFMLYSQGSRANPACQRWQCAPQLESGTIPHSVVIYRKLRRAGLSAHSQRAGFKKVEQSSSEEVRGGAGYANSTHPIVASCRLLRRLVETYTEEYPNIGIEQARLYVQPSAIRSLLTLYLLFDSKQSRNYTFEADRREELSFAVDLTFVCRT
ncbi:hypothetical protein GQ44DRAFT_725880 [Phaeosphaeriaceae sp. PMI808]|nr:hypothetical protein GQ44DRAFT_725880 [Phaeosphaeriaceae sp. PMI808]